MGGGQIFGGIALVAIAVTVALNVSLVNNKADKANLLALANVEALAQGEVTFPWLCRSTSARICVNDGGYIAYGDRIR